jgi:ArsR family transcriptional regulator
MNPNHSPGRAPARRRAKPGSSSGGRMGTASRRSGDSELAALAKALGHPARVAILRLLIERGDCVCGAIVDVLPLAQATVSQHLKVLKQAGLVQGEVDGPRVCYCANPAAVRRLRDMVRGLLPREGEKP